MKPKEALVKDGFLPKGAENKRGRLSGAAIDRCKELAGQGWSIEGYEVSQSTTSTGPIVDKVKVDPNRIFDVPDVARDEDMWSAHTSEGEVGMRTVDNGCGNSLNYCRCQHPRVWIDHETEGVVVFKPRTTPLKKRW